MARRLAITMEKTRADKEIFVHILPKDPNPIDKLNGSETLNGLQLQSIFLGNFMCIGTYLVFFFYSHHSSLK
jgi:hypothetical protein